MERSIYLTRANIKPFKCTECDFCECVGCPGVSHDLLCQDCLSKERVSDHENRITRNDILEAIKNLKNGTFAGIDCISPEHLIHAMSPRLADLLVNIYSIMISLAIIPDIFQNCIIVPILKKATLDSNVPTNYRPIALSSIHTKLVEYLIMPVDQANKSQFGFRKGRGTLFATSLMNDIASYTIAKGSSLYVCSLDAEKCFDSIWH